MTELRTVTELAPRRRRAAGTALGHAYNAVTQAALGTFENQPEDSPWRQLLVADALLADGRFTDAFAIYRTALERLPSMVSIHDSVARIYEQDGPRRLGGAGADERTPVGRRLREAEGVVRVPRRRAIVRRSPPRWPARIRNRSTGAHAPRPS